MGPQNKAGIRNAQDPEYTGVFNIAVYGEIVGTKIFGRIRQESVIHKIRNRQIILYIILRYSSLEHLLVKCDVSRW